MVLNAHPVEADRVGPPREAYDVPRRVRFRRHEYPERKVVTVVAHRPSPYLAQRLGIDRTVMTYLLDDLEGAGLVERQPDPADRRSRRVVATARGAAVLSDLDARFARAEQHLLAALDTDQQAAFRALLGDLATHVNDLDPVAAACEAVEDISARNPA